VTSPSLLIEAHDWHYLRSTSSDGVTSEDVWIRRNYAPFVRGIS